MTTTKRITLEGHVVEVLIATGHTSWQPRGTEVRNSRQVTILSEEELREIAAGPDIPSPEAGWQGANLVQAGIPHLSQLPPGIRLCFPDGTTLAVESENHPCIVPGRLIQPRHPDGPDISKLSEGRRRGLVARVERTGRIRAGDSVRAEIPSRRLYVVDESPVVL